MSLLANELHNDLTTERLSAIVGVYTESRLGASERQDIDFGDDAQVEGIRAYKNFCMTLEAIQGSPGWEWLKTYEPQRKFTLLVGEVPLRVWRSDDPDAEPEDKRLDVAYAAKSQLKLFCMDNKYIDRWAIVYQLGFDRRLDAASLIGYNSVTKQIIKSYSIPLEGNFSVGLSTIDSLPESVKQPEPKAKLKVVADKKEPNEKEFSKNET